MEGPRNAIGFDQTHDTRFFLCRHCRNQILSWDNCLFYEIGAKSILCHNPVNVRVDGILLRWFENQQLLATVACNVCNRNLGQRFVLVAEPDQVIQEGRFTFYTNKLLCWNGTRLVYADTNMPVDN